MTVDDFVRAYVSALSDDGESTIPMATTDADEVIRSQLTENTGRHLLDSGGAHGRNWERNQENPPWEKAVYKVYDGFVVQNVYNHMTRTLERDRLCVALEIALYAFGRSDDEKRNSWLSSMEGFAEALREPFYPEDWVDTFDIPREVAEDIAGSEFGDARSSDRRPFTFNTYNGEFGSISQHIQATALGSGPYAEYWMIQVHGGADIRGGYTSPRVYRSEWDTPMTSEFSYHCDGCGWGDAESCVAYKHPDLIYLKSADGFSLEDAIEEKGWDVLEGAFEEALEEAWDNEDIDGAIFHRCGDGEIGHVHP